MSEQGTPQAGVTEPPPHGHDVQPDTRARMLDARQQAFLSTFRIVGNVTAAARDAGIDRSTHYKWLDRDPAYAEEFADALEDAADRLEAEAYRRAVQGVEEPVFQQGKQVGVIRKYSDTLLVKLLEANRPEKFRPKVHVVTEDALDKEIARLTAELEERKRQQDRETA